MISIDTNVLLYALNRNSPEHLTASAFLEDCAKRDDVAICELVLVELYQLLRNPQVVEHPLSGPDAAETCQVFRRNPRWALVENAPVMSDVWSFAARGDVARRQVFDARIALTLLHHGVSELATKNVNDFTPFEFTRVWDPTAPTA